MTSQSGCSKNTGPMLPGFETCETVDTTTSNQLTLSRVDSRARTSATQENEKVSKENGQACGPSSTESFANYDPDTCSWRTSQRSLFGGWEQFSETWPRAGMMRNGIAYQRNLLEQYTSESEYSLWPTLTARDWRSAGTSLYKAKRRMLYRQKTNQQLDLPTWLLVNIYQTPETGLVNPSFCENLMGFPIGWTELEHSETP